MRLVVWVVLMGATLLSVASGHLRVALLLAAVKALAVGLEFMELKGAARAHAFGYGAFVALLALVLVIIA
ncbi:MAG: hypothetical protein IAE78_23245 [Myxococcus sp.]|nr:hypothetical protein [Myxococcus sp.]